ncbi:PAC2 family protein [Halostagnicola sp. A-GB9-2]|uniref:proteasome assembly chaperone family protein n=1 Tax=Halostagnicola sp. A-GB9-2 TaxID=3048066 RepID=UPI0024BF8FFB|nr:PAC2 family protein [Halostagnicola sp. A-GB9-2]MDJ1432470.1 PAC2 family protein [Halostagnicola sp. A-GB9-2]
MTRTPSFEVHTKDDADAGTVLLGGIADIGAAGLTGIDYLVDHLETTQIGWVSTRNLPVVAPVSDGEPRHPIRLYSVNDTGITILLSELFVPVPVAAPFVDAVLEWTNANGIGEITLVQGTPFPHSEDEHLVFHVGTEAYRRTHFTNESTADIEALPGGVLDGVHAQILVRSLEETDPSVGVLTTPSHPPGPDIDAALRLLDALARLYEIDVDEQELQARSEEMHRYYEELAARLNVLQQNEQSVENRDFPENRMYM